MKKYQLIVLLSVVAMIATGCSEAAHIVSKKVSNEPHFSAAGSLPKNDLIQDIDDGSYDRWYRITSTIVPRVKSQYGVITSGASNGPGGTLSDALRPWYKIVHHSGYRPN